MSRSLACGLVFIWLLASGSSCETTADAGSLTVQSRNGGVAILVGVFVAYCLVDPAACGGGPPTRDERQQAAFTKGLSQYEAGDPTGLKQICLLAHAGMPQAQYAYGVHLFRASPQHPARSVPWLARATAQGNKAAAFLLRQIAGPASFKRPVPASRPALPHGWLCRPGHDWNGGQIAAADLSSGVRKLP